MVMISERERQRVIDLQRGKDSVKVLILIGCCVLIAGFFTHQLFKDKHSFKIDEKVIIKESGRQVTVIEVYQGRKDVMIGYTDNLGVYHRQSVDHSEIKHLIEKE